MIPPNATRNWSSSFAWIRRLEPFSESVPTKTPPDAAEDFRVEILACKEWIRDGWRVVVKKQKDLWTKACVRDGCLNCKSSVTWWKAAKHHPQKATMRSDDNGAYMRTGMGFCRMTVALATAEIRRRQVGEISPRRRILFQIMEFSPLRRATASPVSRAVAKATVILQKPFPFSSYAPLSSLSSSSPSAG